MTEKKTSPLPTNPADRKFILLSALFDYFPSALIEVAKVIAQGKLQHNTEGWARNKSTDHAEAKLRHDLDARFAVFDTDDLRHRGKEAWRVLAQLQTECELDGDPLAPASVFVENFEVKK